MPGPLNVNQGTSFNAIYDQFKPGMLGSGGDQHVRGRGDQLYTHSSFTMHGLGGQAAETRAEKYQLGSVKIQQSLMSEFGPALAGRMLADVGREVGRDLGEGIKRSDLTLLKQKVEAARTDAKTVVNTAIADPASKIGRGFEASIASEYSSENLEFARDVAAFKKAAPAEQADMARGIYDRYIAPNSEKEVNIPGAQKGVLAAAFAEGAPPTTPAVFDDADHEIRQLMVSDSAPRFIKSNPSV